MVKISLPLILGFNLPNDEFDHSSRDQTSGDLQTIISTSGGASNGSAQTDLRKRKNFDWEYHRKMEKSFPDWEKRMDYQKKQEKFYTMAQKKQIELARLKLLDHPKYYTKEELDAMNYFHGTGFYETVQDSSQKPNIFDTRQSFLLKMHNPTFCGQFLKSLKTKNP